jgi:hypothetical protein
MYPKGKVEKKINRDRDRDHRMEYLLNNCTTVAASNEEKMNLLSEGDVAKILLNPPGPMVTVTVTRRGPNVPRPGGARRLVRRSEIQ